ncbi:YbaK/EbsC family protein [Minwuia thermotolerans]|uniref:Aminoacyl-tRNA deacylase n=1 Tax=Minwuia thermotolerans TaxID=2056226 RepID=A0A2M9G2D6_9PROT|nr:YbaK/EbsC family protein [Minwuia thermotolerans]PJK29844.1 aminoacyl-tRNA deacylase [Minwuia thermotolerans]
MSNGEKLLQREPVQRVQNALREAGLDTAIRALSETARTAQDAARSLDCELGAIVKSLVFRAGDKAVMALIAGDRTCDTDALREVLDLPDELDRATPEFVRAETGFTIGGVAPLGHVSPVPIAIDASLARFVTVYAAAGHPHCVFPATFDDLMRATGATASERIAN